MHTAASLRLVSSGVVTDGVTLFTSKKVLLVILKSDDRFTDRRHSHHPPFQVIICPVFL